jgi:hypothetical protein
MGLSCIRHPMLSRKPTLLIRLSRRTRTSEWNRIALTRTIQITTFACLVSVSVALAVASTRPNLIQKAFLKAGGGKKLREEAIARYFDGVDKQNREQIVSCFNPSGTKIRDVCGVSNSERFATPDQLGDRCMEFLAAHPDCKVMFHHP